PVEHDLRIGREHHRGSVRGKPERHGPSFGERHGGDRLGRRGRRILFWNMARKDGERDAELGEQLLATRRGRRQNEGRRTTQTRNSSSRGRPYLRRWALIIALDSEGSTCAAAP